MIVPARPAETVAARRHRRRAGIGEEAGHIGQRRAGLIALREDLDQAARDFVKLALIGDRGVVAQLGEAGELAAM